MTCKVIRQSCPGYIGLKMAKSACPFSYYDERVEKVGKS